MPSDPPKSSAGRTEPIQVVPSSPAPGAEPCRADPSRPLDDAARRIMHRTRIKAGRPRMARDWRDRGIWHPVGYGLTALWMLIVLMVTEADVRHPFFNTIFLVPIGGWVLGLLLARLIARRRPRDGG